MEIQDSSKNQPDFTSSEINIVKSIERKLKLAKNSEQFDEKYKVQSMEIASTTLGKSLRDKNKLSTSWLVHQLSILGDTTESTPKKHKFMFKNTREAAKYNTKLIKFNGYDLEKTIMKQKHTILSPGSEFRHVSHIQKLLENHEDWPLFRDILTKGCDYKLEEEPNEKTRMEDLQSMLQRGNHKSAQSIENAAAVSKAFEKEVSRGWLLPITIESLTKINKLSIIPLGVATQATIDEFGNRIPKKRVTHDASFQAPSGHSINDLVQEDLLQDCIYGHCMRRVLHGIHNIRFHNKNNKIFMSKYDMDAAYRRLHSITSHALKCVTVVGKIAYIPLRLPFGVSPGPSLYSVVSECVFDLVNDLINDKEWDRTILNSPYLPKLAPKQTYPVEEETITQVRELAVYIPNRTAIADGYIDDCLTAAADLEDEVLRSQEAPPLVIHSIFRPIDPAEPIKRDDNISEKKLKGEGQPSEVKTMLGWIINTRKMRVFLPKDKALAWSNDIKTILQANRITHKDLESTIGRLNHIGYILPTGRYFLNRLRHLLQRCDKYGRQQLQQWERLDLDLWLSMIEKVSKVGVSTDNLTFTKITTYLITDACEHGIGGFNIRTGFAWRYKLPLWMTNSFHINLLEFIASVVAIWLDLEFNKNKITHPKILALSDNTSTIGWLYKSNFNVKSHPGHDRVARQVAKILLENEASIESQHIKGSHNVIADSLSRDHHLKETHLKFILTSLFPSQVPQNFSILSTLPEKITSWLESLKDITINAGVSPPKHSRSKTGLFFDGEDSWTDVVSKTNSLMTSLRHQKSPSSQHSLPLLDEMRMARTLNPISNAEQSCPPSTLYVRPFGRTFGTTRLSMPQDQGHYPSKDNFVVTPNQMEQ